MDDTESSWLKKHKEELKDTNKKHTENLKDDIKKLKEDLAEQCDNEKLQMTSKLEREYDRTNTINYTSWKLKSQGDMKT